MIFSHFFYLFRATAWLLLAFWRATVYFKEKAIADLNIPAGMLMTSKEKRRLKHYFFGTTYLSIVFCSLRQKTRTRQEKIAFTNLAALAYFFDDLVDEFGKRDDSGIIWRDNPEAYGQKADRSGLALHFLHNIYAALPERDLQSFKNYMHRVFNVETAGRQQQEIPLALPELMTTMAEKGGGSVLMFRRVLANPLDATEERALYAFGRLIQLCDDIFDVWFDRKSGIQTAPIALLEEDKLDALLALFDAEVAATRTAFLQIQGYTRVQRHTAWTVVHFIVSIARVCLKNYKILREKHGNLPLENRAAMVTDMESWPNRARATYYLLFAY